MPSEFSVSNACLKTVSAFTYILLKIKKVIFEAQVESVGDLGLFMIVFLSLSKLNNE